MAEQKLDRPDGQEFPSDPGSATADTASTDQLSPAEQLAEEKKRADEYLDNWRRSVAEFSNFRKRVEKEKSDYRQYANQALLARLLEVLDGFDAALSAIPERFHNEPWVEGVRLVDQKLRRVLESEGVKPIEVEGQDFDPNFHEAMFYEPSPGQPEGRVIGEFQRGYMLGDRVLRPSRVKVAKGEGQTENKE